MNQRTDGDTTLTDAAQAVLQSKRPLDAIAEELVAKPATPPKGGKQNRARPPRQSHPDEITPDGLVTEGKPLTPKSTKVREEDPADSGDDEDLVAQGQTDDDADDDNTDDEASSNPFDFLDDLTAEEGEEPTPAADDDQPESESDGEVFKVKVDGKVEEVTLADLKRSYSREGAFDKRMQEATEARNKAEATVREEMQPYIREVTDFHQRLKHVYDNYNEVLFAPRVPPPDPSMRETDPLGYSLHVQDFQADQLRMQQERQQMEQTLKKAKEIDAEQRKEQLGREAQELYRKLPGLKNPQASKVFKAKIAEVGAAHGFTPAEIAAASDHRILTLAAEAAAYRELKASLQGKRQGNAPPAKKRPLPTKGNNRPNTPSSRRQAQRKKVMAKARETGSVDDVANTLLL